MTEQLVVTPVQAAFIALHEHSLTCPQCRPVWVGNEPTFAQCPEEDRLAREWRRLEREQRS